MDPVPVSKEGEAAMARSAPPDWLTPHRAASPDAPHLVETTTPEGATVRGEFTAVERSGCAVRGLEVKPAQPLPADVNELRSRAANLSDALPGGLAIQEADASAPSVLMRSPARPQDAGVEYEEAVVATGGVSVRRVAYSPDTGRQTAELPVTWEQFDTFVDAARKAVGPQEPA
jgi:hypothetical protein